MSEQWVDLDAPMQPPVSEDVVSAGFLRRWAALFVDQLICGTVFNIFSSLITSLMFAGISLTPESWLENPMVFAPILLVLLLLYFLMVGAYYSVMESSKLQATVGKLALGIKVVDAHGQRLSYLHALGRWVAASLSYFTLYIGFLMAGFTKHKQALHDLVANTHVVDRWAYTEFPERQQRQLGGCLIAFVIAMVLLLLLVIVGVIAAISVPAYLQYTARAEFSKVGQSLVLITENVESAWQVEGRCPTNRSYGFGAPESYAADGINRIVFDEFTPGECGISVWLPPTIGSVERQFLAEYNPSLARWRCTFTSDPDALPAWCN